MNRTEVAAMLGKVKEKASGLSVYHPSVIHERSNHLSTFVDRFPSPADQKATLLPLSQEKRAHT